MSTTHAEVLSALKSNLKVANDYSKLSLSSGYTAPPDAERVLNQTALTCAEKYVDDEEKQRMPMLAATMAKFSISSQAKKTDTMMSEILRASVTRGANVSREELSILESYGTADAMIF